MSGIIGALLAFAFGAALGSFLNVVIMRYPAEAPTGRSHCPHCGKTLPWPELAPLISFAWQRGRCRRCRHQLSWQYPLVEGVMGLITLALFMPVPEDPLAFALASLAAAISALLIVLFVIDLRTMFLPDIFIFLLALFVAAHVALRITSYGLPVTSSLWGAAIGTGFLALLWAGTAGRGIGLGDVKLMLPLGAFFGPIDTAFLLLTAFIV